jgi:uncharacterized protein
VRGRGRRGSVPAALLALALTSGAALAEPALWKVSDDDSHVWLFGSVHILDEQRDWRTPRFDAALSDSELVYFEVILDVEAYSTMTQLTFTEGMNRGGKTLDDFLTIDQRAILRGIAAANGLDYAVLKRMRPWLAELTLIQQTGLGLDMTSSAGVETLIADEIEDEREREFETPEFQFNLLAGRSEADQVASLMATANSLGLQKGMFAQMIDDWLAGRTEGLHAVMTGELGGIEDPTYKRLISDRNRDWVTQIEGILERNESAMIIVGAGHLAGPVSVQSLLEARGYTVTLESAPPEGDAPVPVTPR